MKLNCSQCGGQLDVTPTDRFLSCAYCGSALLVLLGRTYQPILVKPLLSPGQAQQSLSGRPDLPVEFIGYPELVFIPYWIEAEKLSLAAPSRALTDGIPSLRAKPAGEIAYRQDIFGEEFPSSAFLDPETVPSPQEDIRGVFYVPFYRFNIEAADQKLIVNVDALDGSLLNFDSADTITSPLTPVLIWGGAVLLVPLGLALSGTSALTLIAVSGIGLPLLYYFLIWRR